MTTPRYKLLIGNKNWSSWSLRPWLAMSACAIPFEEINIRLRQPETKAQILRHSPSGFVPALIDGDLTVWDSLAIIEYLADQHPAAGLWPEDRTARALARAASAEMHSGFRALRQECSMEILAHNPMPALSPETSADVIRIVSLWLELRRRFGAGGPYLCGSFSGVDAMYAPVASRFRTYVQNLADYGDDGMAQAYVDTIFAMPEIGKWIEGARKERASAGA
jgi:glutathione S-transferase